MNIQTINYILTNRRYPNSTFKSILLSIGLIVFIGMSFFVFFGILFQTITTDILQKNPYFSFLIFFGLLLFLISVLIIYYFKSEVESLSKFEEIKTQNELSTIIDILNKNLPDFFILTNSKSKNNYMTFETYRNILTHGERITIIFNENRILINSKSLNFQLFSFGTHKRNLDKIKKILILNKQQT